MRAPALILSLLLTSAAALAALVILLPAFNQSMAFLAVAVDEKTLLAAAAAIVGAVLAWSCGRPGRWLAPAASMGLAAFAAGVSMIPPGQAVRLARGRPAAREREGGPGGSIGGAAP